MRSYFQKALGAGLRAGRGLVLLTVLGVALGVGSVLSIRILDQGALGAFEGTVRAVSGDAALTVVGTGPSFPEEVYPSVLAEAGVAAAVPLTRTEAAVEGEPPLFLEVLGVDLLAPVRLPVQGERREVAGALGSPGWIAVTPELAAERGWKVGDGVRVSAGGRRATLRIGALVDFRRVSPLASRRLGVMDIAEAQSLLGPVGRLHQVDVFLAPGADAAEVAARLQSRLGPGVRVTTPEQRVAEASGLLAAFRMNLTALSLISLFVGGFLVYGSTQAAMVRRREEIGVLRCLGATRRQVLALLLGEALLLGMAGTALGIPLGWLAARLELRSVSATVQNLYLLEGIDRVALTPALLALAVTLGVAGSLAGALFPALDVSRRDPRALLASLTLEERTSRAARPLLVAAVLAPALAVAGYAALGRGSPLGGLPGGAGHPRRAAPRRAGAGPGPRARRAAAPVLLRVGGPHARPSPPVIGGRGGRAGGGGGHAHRDHGHGLELPRHRDRVARRHPARRPLRHHAHLEPRPWRGHALPGRARPGWAGIPTWRGSTGCARPSSGWADGACRWWAWTRPFPAAPRG